MSHSAADSGVLALQACGLYPMLAVLKPKHKGAAMLGTRTDQKVRIHLASVNSSLEAPTPEFGEPALLRLVAYDEITRGAPPPHHLCITVAKSLPLASLC